VDGPGIADLEVSSSQIETLQTSRDTLPTQSAQLSQSQQSTVIKENQALAGTSAATQQQPFVDPAILSFSKPPSKAPSHPKPLTVLSTNLDNVSRPSAGSASSMETAHPPRTVDRHDSAVTAILTEPFSNVQLREEPLNEGVLEQARKGVVFQDDSMKHPGKRSRRGGRNKNDENGDNLRGNGWRQTAFVESVQPQSHTGYPSEDQPFQDNGKRRGAKNRKSYTEDPSGWATEGATDIQELGDFDFQGNLSKFDKRRVFDEIRNDDTTADEERLVSFNRKAKPGTNGGKNLHWTENVLDSTPVKWNSEAGETETETSDDKFSSGNYSGRDRSGASTHTQTSRKASNTLNQSTMTASFGSIGRAQLSSSRNPSPLPGKNSPLNGPMSIPAGTLRLMTTKRSCPTVSPLQMLEIEQLAVTELGLSEDMIIENAGRGIAEAAVTQVNSDTAAPAVLVLTGNHRTGGRAIAAARHLRNRGHRVTLCLLGLEQEVELLENCRKQLEIFKKIGGRVYRWEELSTRLSTSDFAVDLVVDALFGIHIAFEDLRTDDQATAFEMISWMNRSKLEIISVDIPSGVSASTGEILSLAV
jgi:enhancer of mRNA-decapping protein 3